jgi:hypothetical protein
MKTLSGALFALFVAAAVFVGGAVALTDLSEWNTATWACFATGVVAWPFIAMALIRQAGSVAGVILRGAGWSAVAWIGVAVCGLIFVKRHSGGMTLGGLVDSIFAGLLGGGLASVAGILALVFGVVFAVARVAQRREFRRERVIAP